MMMMSSLSHNSLYHINNNTTTVINQQHQSQMNNMSTLSLESILQTHLDKIQTHSQCNQTRITLYNIFRNILVNEHELKFRKIKVGVPKFQERIIQVNGALDFLLACHFEIQPPVSSMIELVTNNDAQQQQNMSTTTSRHYLVLKDEHYDKKVLLTAENMVKLYPITVQILDRYSQREHLFSIMIDCFTSMDQLKTKIIEASPTPLPMIQDLKFELLECEPTLYSSNSSISDNVAETCKYVTLNDDFDEELMLWKSARQLKIHQNSIVRVTSCSSSSCSDSEEEVHLYQALHSETDNFQFIDSGEDSFSDNDDYDDTQQNRNNLKENYQSSFYELCTETNKNRMRRKRKHRSDHVTEGSEASAMLQRYKRRTQLLKKQMYEQDRQNKKLFDRTTKQLQQKIFQQDIEIRKLKQTISSLEHQLALNNGNTEDLNRLTIGELMDLQKSMEEAKQRVHKCAESRWIEMDDALCCVVCRDKRKSILFQPCNHLCVCESCSIECRTSCPLCRAQIQSKVKVYAYGE